MNRTPVLHVIALTFVTLGVYTFVWLYRSKEELNAAGAQIPSLFWVFVPTVNIWWFWRYGKGLELVSGGRLNHVTTFVFLLLLDSVGIYLLQYQLNRLPAA